LICQRPFVNFEFYNFVNFEFYNFVNFELYNFENFEFYNFVNIIKVRDMYVCMYVCRTGPLFSNVPPTPPPPHSCIVFHSEILQNI
jgi:hypothetical protein